MSDITLPATDADLIKRLLSTQPSPAECLVAAARLEQLVGALADQRTALQAAIDAAKAEARAEDAQAVNMLVFAAQTFCNRVEAGEIRSKRSYAMFKDTIAQIGAKP